MLSLIPEDLEVPHRCPSVVLHCLVLGWELYPREVQSECGQDVDFQERDSPSSSGQAIGRKPTHADPALRRRWHCVLACG